MESLLADLASLLESSDKSDLTLVCCDGEVKVHRAIMAARSPAFNAMLESEMIEPITGRIEVKDFGISVVKAMAQFMYTAKIDEEFKEVVELLKIGNKYLIMSLVEECCKMLVQEISKDNVFELGMMAETLFVKDLLKSCAGFVADNWEEISDVWEEKLKNSPLFLMSIIKTMKEKEEFEFVCSRFGGIHAFWWCDGDHLDEITIKLTKAATLTSVGLYGTEFAREIPVKIDILNSELESIFSMQTVYQCTGSSEPVMVPVQVRMEADTEYTVQALINSGSDDTYAGMDGKEEVIYDDNFKVVFKNSSNLENDTEVGYGQIPALGFKFVK